jgi:hypothetical protein
MAKLNEDKILIIKGVQEFRSSGGKPYGFFYPEIHEYIF